jgi:hypothetical protein
MARRIRQRNCRNCKDLFLPDYRNVKKQEFCKKTKCRDASKKASNRKWLQKKENQDYHSGPSNVQRVQEWRKLNPGYSKNKKKISSKALQDHWFYKNALKQRDETSLTIKALQDHLIAQQTVIVGLIANLTGNTLQDDIAKSVQCMEQLGSDILSCSIQNIGGNYDSKKTSIKPSTHPPGAQTVQLGRSPTGP